MATDILEHPQSPVSVRDFLILGKAGITTMVLVTAAAGVLLAPGDAGWRLWVAALAGTALVSAGAAALNQVVERKVDAQMERTQRRPLPAGRIDPLTATLVGVLATALGTVLLALEANLLAAAIALATAVGYVAIYTPFKRVSSLATIVGAAPGAAPPLIGWAAAAGNLAPGAWVLFAMLFVWQLPHFLAIAWMYRDDYERGGFPLITIDDPGARRTGRQAVLWAAALIPVSLLPTALGLTGMVYFIGAALLGMAFLAAAGVFAVKADRPSARRLMFTSILYLPAILALLALDHLP